MRRWVCLLLFFVLSLAACTPPKPAPTFAPYPTRIPPTPTATLFVSVSAGTPVPAPEAPIGADNLEGLSLLARWGNGMIMQVTTDPQGRRLATATPLGIYLYDLATYQEQEFIPFPEGLTSIAFSPDGTMLAAASPSGGVQLLQASDGSTAKSLKSPPNSIDSVAFSPDGQLIAGGSGDGAV